MLPSQAPRRDVLILALPKAETGAVTTQILANTPTEIFSARTLLPR